MRESEICILYQKELMYLVKSYQSILQDLHLHTFQTQAKFPYNEHLSIQVCHCHRWEKLHHLEKPNLEKQLKYQ